MTEILLEIKVDIFEYINFVNFKGYLHDEKLFALDV